MYVYEKKEKKHVAQFLGEVHKMEQVKYNARRNPLVKKARELQEFLQEIKYAFNHPQEAATLGELLDEEALSLIIESIHNQQKNMKRIFSRGGRIGGFQFERDLQRVITAVMENVSAEDIKIDKNQILIGAKSGNIETIDADLEKWKRDILEAIGMKTYTEVKAKNGRIIRKYYLPSVTGKIDVQGYKIDVRADANLKLLYLYSLLKDATFSAKSYSSISFKTKQDLSETNIHLGNTNLYRAIVGSLTNLGYANGTATSAFYAGYNEIMKNKDDVKQHFFHLKYIYELTGGGIKYDGVDLGEVKYLVYNDPASDGIYVKSTPEILADVLDGNIVFSGNLLSGISINKKFFTKKKTNIRGESRKK